MKIDFKEVVRNVPYLRQRYSQMNMLYYGSTVTGLMQAGSSDIDLALFLSEEGVAPALGAINHQRVLDEIHKHLVDHFSSRYSILLLKGLKRLYILRISDLKYNGINLDICVNNILGIYNSRYIQTYCQLDERYHSLCRIVKRLHEAVKPYRSNYMMKLTNYSFNLMILVYLMEKKVVPNIIRDRDRRGEVVYEMQYPAKNNPRKAFFNT